ALARDALREAWPSRLLLLPALRLFERREGIAHDQRGSDRGAEYRAPSALITPARTRSMSGRKEYARAPEVAEIAKRLIELFHPHLVGVRIEYVWVSKPPVIGGRPRAACMRKVSGLYAYLATPGSEGEPKPFFVMEVCLPLWRVARP